MNRYHYLFLALACLNLDLGIYGGFAGVTLFGKIAAVVVGLIACGGTAFIYFDTPEGWPDALQCLQQHRNG